MAIEIFKTNEVIQRIKKALGKIYYKRSVVFEDVIDYIVYNKGFVEPDSGADAYYQHKGLLQLYDLYLEMGCGRDVKLNEYKDYGPSEIDAGISEESLSYVVLSRARSYFHKWKIREPFRENVANRKRSLLSRLFSRFSYDSGKTEDFNVDHVDVELDRSHHLTNTEKQIIHLLNNFDFSAGHDILRDLRYMGHEYGELPMGPFDCLPIAEYCLESLWQSVEVHLTKFPKTQHSDEEWGIYLDAMQFFVHNYRHTNEGERHYNIERICKERFSSKDLMSPDMLGCYVSPQCNRGKHPVIHLYMDRISSLAEKTHINRLHIVLWVYVHEMVHAALDRYPYLFVKPVINEIEEPVTEFITLNILYNFEKSVCSLRIHSNYFTRGLFKDVFDCVFAKRHFPNMSYYSLALDMLYYGGCYCIVSDYYDHMYEIDKADNDVQTYLEDFYKHYPKDAHGVLDRFRSLMEKINQKE